MSNPLAVTVDSERNVYVADNYNDRIQKFAPTRFTDVSDPQWDWARGYIEVLWQTNLTQGYGSTSVFAPGVNVTRDQMAAFIIRAKEGEPGAYYCASGSPFSDVSPDNWACPYIKRLKELGLTTGYGGNPSIYEPLIIVSRDQMAAFLIRSVEGEPDPNHCASGSPFNDVSPDSWVCPYAKRLKELGLTNGYGSPTIYAPSVQVNRAQMAAFLTRAFIGMQ
jgi:rubredoxin